MQKNLSAVVVSSILTTILTTSFGRAQGEKGEEFSIGDISTHVLKVQYEGEQFNCPRKVLDFKKDEIPKVSTKTVTATFKYLALGKEEKSGFRLSRYVIQSRTVRFDDVKFTNGRYKSVKTNLEPSIRFLSLDGKEVERKEMANRFGTKAFGVLILGIDQKISKSWKKVIRADVLQVRSKDLVSKISAGMGDRQTLDESLAQLSGHVINIRFDGNSLVYPKKSPKLRKDEQLRTVVEPVPVTISSIVSFQEEVNRRAFVFQQKVDRIVKIPALRPVDAKLEATETAIGKNTKFYTPDGLEISHAQVVKKIGMKEVPFLALPENSKIQKLWKLVLKNEVLIVCSNAILAAAYNNSLVSGRGTDR